MNWLKKNKLVTILSIIVLSIIISIKYIYQPHQKTEDLNTIFQGNPQQFKHEILKEPSRYHNAIVEIKGKVISKGLNGIMLEESIYCAIKDSTIIEKNIITIKGRFIGYDDLMEEFKIDKCIIKE